MKLSLDEIKFLYDVSYSAMIKTLFEENFSNHGWKYEEYEEALVERAIAISEGKIQTWVH